MCLTFTDLKYCVVFSVFLHLTFLFHKILQHTLYTGEKMLKFNCMHITMIKLCGTIYGYTRKQSRIHQTWWSYLDFTPVSLVSYLSFVCVTYDYKLVRHSVVDHIKELYLIMQFCSFLHIWDGVELWLHWLMAQWPQQPLFTDITGDVPCPQFLCIPSTGPSTLLIWI